MSVTHVFGLKSQKKFMQGMRKPLTVLRTRKSAIIRSIRELLTFAGDLDILMFI